MHRALTQGFSSFLRRRRAQRHFERRPLLETLAAEQAAKLAGIGMTLLIVALGLWLPNGALAGYFGLHALPPAYYAWLVVILLGYCTLVTLMKRIYIRRFGWQ